MSDVNYPGFKKYYLGSSRYSQKEKIVEDFSNVYYSIYGLFPGGTRVSWLKENYKADMKKKLKIQLMGRGHTAAGADGIIKSFGEWVKTL